MSVDRYPNRPIRLVVPYTSGSSTDIVGRIVAQQIGEILGANMIVDHKPGAGSSIGADPVGSSPAEFSAFVGSEIAASGELIRDVGITLE